MILSSFAYKALVPKQPFISPHVLNSSTNSRKSLIKIPSVDIMFNDFDSLTTSVCWMISKNGLLSFLYILFHFPLVFYVKCLICLFPYLNTDSGVNCRNYPYKHTVSFWSKWNSVKFTFSFIELKGIIVIICNSFCYW